MVDEADKALADFAAGFTSATKPSVLPEDVLIARDTPLINSVKSFLQRAAETANQHVGGGWRVTFQDFRANTKSDTTEITAIIREGELPRMIASLEFYAGWFQITAPSKGYIDNIGRKDAEVYAGLSAMMSAAMGRSGK